MSMHGDDSGPERELGEALRDVMRSLMRPEPLPEELERLPMSQFRCLMTVKHHPGRKMNEIAELMQIKLPALSQVVTRLVRRGLLQRESHPEDRRIVQLKLTPRSEQLLMKDFQNKRARLRRTYENLSEAGLRDVVKGLRILAEAARTGDPAGEGQAPSADDDAIIVKLPLT